MSKKQTSNTQATNQSVANAAPARAAKPNTSRAKTAKHSRAVSAEPAQMAAIDAVFTAPETAVVTEDLIIIAAPADNGPEAIAKIAYLYWEGRGYQGGDPLEDWVRAEEEYGRRYAATRI